MLAKKHPNFSPSNIHEGCMKGAVE